MALIKNNKVSEHSDNAETLFPLNIDTPGYQPALASKAKKCLCSSGLLKMGFKLILGFVAVAAASAAARFALARMSRHAEKHADQEDEVT